MTSARQTRRPPWPTSSSRSSGLTRDTSVLPANMTYRHGASGDADRRPGRARHGQRPAADRPAHRRARRHRHRSDPARDRRGKARQGHYRQAPVALREAPRASRNRDATALPPDLIDYVLVHELAHVRHADHGPDFWRAVERPLPDFATRRTRLRLTGPVLWLPGDAWAPIPLPRAA